MKSNHKWKVLQTELLMQASFFKMRKDRCELPDGRSMPAYYVFEFTDWVNVVPITPQGQMVLVRQYRHAAQSVELEIPGGSLHLANEEPLLAGKRELKEETGYESSNWIYLGAHKPNPALQNNFMHSYLALDCKKVAEPQLDPYEDLSVELHSVEQVVESLFKGQIQHSLIMASLLLALPHLQQWTSQLKVLPPHGPTEAS